MLARLGTNMVEWWMPKRAGLVGLFLLQACAARHPFQVPQCVVPHHDSAGARPGWWSRAVEPLVEDDLLATYGNFPATVSQADRNAILERVLARCDAICAD